MQIALAGISLEIDIEAGEKKSRGRFREDLLFTHRGLSGPAVLQASSFWRDGAALTLDLLGRVLATNVVDPETGFCIGCGRTRLEIGGWLGMSPDQRRHVMAELPERVEGLTRRKTRRGGRAGRLQAS